MGISNHLHLITLPSDGFSCLHLHGGPGPALAAGVKIIDQGDAGVKLAEFLAATGDSR